MEFGIKVFPSSILVIDFDKTSNFIFENWSTYICLIKMIVTPDTKQGLKIWLMPKFFHDTLLWQRKTKIIEISFP